MENRTLSELLREAAGRPMTDAEWQAQRESWVRGMTQGCEHGVLDFETCVECRLRDQPHD